jgi:hypothetical protein
MIIAPELLTVTYGLLDRRQPANMSIRDSLGHLHSMLITYGLFRRSCEQFRSFKKWIPNRMLGDVSAAVT